VTGQEFRQIKITMIKKRMFNVFCDTGTFATINTNNTTANTNTTIARIDIMHPLLF
jgi:hypothetical protein